MKDHPVKALLRCTRPLPGLLCALTLSIMSGSAVLVTTGCGGGGNKVSAPATRKAGRATLTLVWPSSGTRLIPDAAQSVVVTVVDDQGNHYSTPDGSPLVLPRPAGGGTSSATFDPLPVGTLTVTATAYPNSDGTGTAQATATGPLVIQADQNSTVTLTMQSTIDHITVSPPTASISLDGTTQFSATAYDSAGNMVLVVPGSLVFGATKTGYALPVSGDATSGNIHGVGVGTVGITATDPESGKSGQASLTVKRTAAYSITLIRARSRAVAINNAGQVLGNVTADLPNSQTSTNAFLWTPDSSTGLHVLTGQMIDLPHTPDVELVAYGMNDLGQVVGASVVLGTVPGPSQPFSWANGQVSYYTLPAGTTSGWAVAINKGGVILGQPYSGTRTPCTWTLNNPAPTVLSTSQWAFSAINDSGIAVGSANPNALSMKLDAQGNLAGPRTALPSLIANPLLRFDTAYGINAQGDVVGMSQEPVAFEAAFWPKEGGIVKLPWVDGPAPYTQVANAVNKKRQIVGASVRPGGDPGRAVLWQAGAAHDLNTMIPPGTGWVLTWAVGINDRGQIVGYGNKGAFLLTPQDGSGGVDVGVQ